MMTDPHEDLVEAVARTIWTAASNDRGPETTARAVLALIAERTKDALSLAAWRHESGDSYSQALDKGARDQSKSDYDAVVALLSPKEKP